MGTTQFDLVVLGGGTGGYVAAIRASQLGLKVAIVEKEKLGGTCLHRGCIPSKALLRSAEVFHTVTRGDQFGVNVSGISINFLKMQERKQKIVDQLHSGVQYLIKKGEITVFYGEGRIMGPSIFSPIAGAVAVSYEDGKEADILVSKNLLIATGSKPRTLPGLDIDGEYILTSDEALQLNELPTSIVIIGGGAIGIEWASLLSDFGVDVHLVEYADRILPAEDEAVSKEMTRLLQKRKIKISTETKVIKHEISNKTLTLFAEKNGEVVELVADKVLVSVGRAANIDDIGLNNTDVKIENEAIKVNEFYQTEEPHIYAIGDVIGGLQLAHVAASEGRVAVEHMAGVDPLLIDYTNVPKVTYSRPEVASIGLTEEEAKEKGLSIKTGTFPFKAIGKALIYGEQDGFVKMISNEETNDLLGIHMIGPNVSDLIAEGALAKIVDATPWEVSQTIHPHPSLAEIMGEVALDIDKIAIHS